MNWVEFVVWCIIIITTIVIEINTITLTSIWFSIAGIVSLVLTVFLVSFEIQLLVFSIVSIVLLVATRPLVRSFLSNKSVIKTNADKYISMIGIVTLDILAGEIGEVKVNSEIWRAVSLENTDIKTGEKIIVNSITGNKFLVSRVASSSSMEVL